MWNWHTTGTIPLTKAKGETSWYFTIRGSKLFYSSTVNGETVWNKVPGFRFAERRRILNNSGNYEWINMFHTTKKPIYKFADGTTNWEDGKDYTKTSMYKKGIEFSDLEIKLVSIDEVSNVPLESIIERKYVDESNINGYFIRLKNLNNQLTPISKEINGYSGDLVKEKAKLEVAKNTIEAATQGLQ
jgi:hypothetical protein